MQRTGTAKNMCTIQHHHLRDGCGFIICSIAEIWHDRLLYQLSGDPFAEFHSQSAAADQDRRQRDEMAGAHIDDALYGRIRRCGILCGQSRIAMRIFPLSAALPAVFMPGVGERGYFVD